jgi:hypothetical protein
MKRQGIVYQDSVYGAEVYRLDGGRLELGAGRGRTTAVSEEKVRWRSDPEDLVGTRWKVRSIDGERPVEGSVSTVHFRTEKEVSWYDGCQNFGGRYFASENDLEVPDVGVVGGCCMKPPPTPISRQGATTGLRTVCSRYARRRGARA